MLVRSNGFTQRIGKAVGALFHARAYWAMPSQGPYFYALSYTLNTSTPACAGG